MEALERAHEVRSARAQIKKQIKAGTMTVLEALDEPACQTMTIFKLVQAQHNWGSSTNSSGWKTRDALMRVGLNPERRVMDLTLRQRELLRHL